MKKRHPDESAKSQSNQSEQPILLIATVAGLFAAPALLAQHNHGDHGAQPHGAAPRSEPAAAGPKPVQAVFSGYLKIQTALAQDTLLGVSTQAAAIAKTVQADPARNLPAAVAKQAEALAKAMARCGKFEG